MVIFFRDRTVDNQGMRESEIRKRNLRTIVRPDERGNVAEFCRKHELDPTWIRQLLNQDKTFGEKAARNLERQIGLPRGELDNKPDGGDLGDIESAIKRADFLNDGQKSHLVGLIRTLAASGSD
jgi:hypothetical protein